ncbi:MAG: DUF547 domain-containing protein [Lentisphaeraceae bacterium]|nr:DUF547 domain-containing protein [Lentisphaeraceae bacterium]
MKFLALLITLSIVMPVQADNLWENYSKILKAGIVELNFSGPHGQFQHNAFDYKTIASKDENQKLLKAQIDVLKQSPAPTNRYDKLAFWINAYNFFTIVDVTNKLDEESMKDIGWKNKRHLINGKKHSLDQIEHEIIRPMNDARIHFAVNCASVSCPGLKAAPFTGQGIRKELTEQTKGAFLNPLHLRKEDGELYATKLLDWFEEDFEIQLFGNNEGFIKRYAPKDLNGEIEEWIDYNWQFNTKENVVKALKKLKVELIEK